ncbi:MAG: cytochrome c [Verrucomicrobiales bacterium]|nr:cytochrome c [Verrucomicrobiales bacterium]
MKKSRTASQGNGPKPASSPVTPKVGSYTAPAAFFVVLAILAYLSQAELGYHHGLFSAGIYEPYTDFRSIPKVGGEVNRVDAGREVYAAAGCVACHQPNGSGNPANGCPPLAKSDWVLAEGPARLIRIVLHGAQGPITVNGKPWNGNMTPFGPVLNDDQIANVLTFIRQSPEWGNNAGEVTPEMVKAVREKTASRTTQWTPAELEKIPETE